ncbi:hypothetical protein FS935_18650 [Metabacillus litoralis]|uniref:Uncharacterized protein n=1 Tax=Metabacillus litoralis TaxID=152268 RepID=A0A5C6VNE2_9BACI|nr:DUF6054 family protein [Metabacillus litoralis]TXC86066.1 hypothetical protein FS935_18650 [Metabacillus litoralis]
MKKYSEFKLNIEPFEAAMILTENSEIKELIVFYDYKVADDDKRICLFVLEKFFLRNSSTASLTVTIDNFEGETIMKCVSTGNGEGLFDIGWGAGRSFINSARHPLEAYIIEVIRED